VPELSQKSVSGVRVTKATDRDHGAPIPGTQLGNMAALEKDLLRVLADIREMRHEVNAGLPVKRRKTREAVPALVHLIYVNFPVEYAE
jgi:hypothetical protein